MKRTEKVTIAATILLWLLLTISSVSAYRWDSSIQGPNYTKERHDSIQKAFETNDYNAWKNLMDGKWRVTEIVNADNFSKFTEAHNLAINGNLEWAKAIRIELGLWLGNWRWRWEGKGKIRDRKNGNCLYNK